jgi:zinc and cadmium transporter
MFLSNYYNIILFCVTLLAFSGSFLLGITFLHMLPETMSGGGHWTGALLLLGFFIQQIIQRLTHGIEHGHLHVATDHGHHHTSVMPILVGLSIHAFSEGIPLGIHYEDEATLPSLYAAIALHKLPEVMLISSLLMIEMGKNKAKAWLYMVLFALITPLSSTLTAYLGAQFNIVNQIIDWCIPVVAGVFIHIATTIFFESGTRMHEMNAKKWLAITLGVGIALLTTVGHSH